MKPEDYSKTETLTVEDEDNPRGGGLALYSSPAAAERNIKVALYFTNQFSLIISIFPELLCSFFIILSSFGKLLSNGFTAIISLHCIHYLHQKL